MWPSTSRSRACLVEILCFREPSTAVEASMVRMCREILLHGSMQGLRCMKFHVAVISAFTTP